MIVCYQTGHMWESYRNEEKWAAVNCENARTVFILKSAILYFLQLHCEEPDFTYVQC